MGFVHSSADRERPLAAADERITTFAPPPPAPDPRCTLATVLDELGIAACVVGPRDRELHRSTRMRELLAMEPDAARLLATVGAVARELLERARETPTGHVVRDPEGVEGARAVYRLRGLALPAGGAGPEPVAIVELERSGAALPPTEDLIARCGLTRREAEIALHLAVGESDREVAQTLAISPHTVRKHAEHIFDKLRLHSRKALLLRLSEATRPSRGDRAAPKVRQDGDDEGRARSTPDVCGID